MWSSWSKVGSICMDLWFEEHHMFETYIQQIRSIAEMSCPVRICAITQVKASSLERVQRTALAIIRGENNTTYKDALRYFNISSLKTRRETSCFKFVINAYKIEINKLNRTTRYGKSPIPYLNELLNTHLMEKERSKIPEGNQAVQIVGLSL